MGFHVQDRTAKRVDMTTGVTRRAITHTVCTAIVKWDRITVVYCIVVFEQGLAGTIRLRFRCYFVNLDDGTVIPRALFVAGF